MNVNDDNPKTWGEIFSLLITQIEQVSTRIESGEADPKEAEEMIERATGMIKEFDKQYAQKFSPKEIQKIMSEIALEDLTLN